MSNLLLMHVGAGLAGTPAATSSSAADPQLQFFENFPGHLGVGIGPGMFGSVGIPYFHAVNIPLSLSFNNVVILASKTHTNPVASISFGLFSMNAGTLSLANSASASWRNTDANGLSWISLVTSVTQNITPGAWYFGIKANRESNAFSALVNTSFNPANAVPGGFAIGRGTSAEAGFQASYATSALDITGSDAIRQNYIIITA